MRPSKNDHQAIPWSMVIGSALMLLSALVGCGADDPEGTARGDSSGSSGGSSGRSSASGSQGGSSRASSSSHGGASSGGTSKSSSAGSSGGSSSGGAASSGGTSSSGGSSRSGGSTGSSGGASGGSSKAGGSGGSAGAGGSTAASSSKGGSTGMGGTSALGGVSGSGGKASSGGTTGTGGGTATKDKFSFFVMSYAALQKIAGNTKGLGGDLRHGETGAGAGLRGADKMCSEVAEISMKGAGAKTWRAFLSVTADENGKQVDAIDRIGKGPWYDRMGRLFANSLEELYYDRPKNADAAIKMDFPNENGVLNHNPDKTGNVDNHDFLTGSSEQGKLYGSTATCSDWTSTSTTGSKPRVGHTWPTSTMMCQTDDVRTRTGTGGAGGGGPGGGFPGGGGGVGNLCNWMSALDEAGCAPGVNLAETGGPGNDGTVGSGGGYGGFYCFALTP